MNSSIFWNDEVYNEKAVWSEADNFQIDWKKKMAMFSFHKTDHEQRFIQDGKDIVLSLYTARSYV